MTIKKTKKIPELTEKYSIRFWSKATLTANPDMCWNWYRSKNSAGYGGFGIGKVVFRVNRVAYFLTYKIDPMGLCVCHTCDNRACVNPNHLFLGTDQDNTDDMIRKGRSATPKGKPLPSYWGKTKIRGEAHINAKLTDIKVSQIIKLYSKGNITHDSLSKKFGVSIAVIHNVIKGKAWKHLGVSYHKDVKDMKKGELHPSSKLTEKQVLQIRALYIPKYGIWRELAKKFGVSCQLISNIINRKAWKHI